MSQTIKLNLNESEYQTIKSFAKKDNRTLSNLLKTAVLNFIEKSRMIDDFEMQEILGNEQLLENLKLGSLDAKNKKGRFVDTI